MSSLDKFYDFTLNLPDAKLTSKAMSLCNIDRNVFNIYLTLQEGKNNPISNESLGDYTVTMIVVKPKTKEYVEKIGVIDGSNDRLLFELGETFNDQIGSYKGEIKVQNGDEVITSSSFAYTVTQSLISGLNAEIEANPDVEILRQLINEVKAAVGMTPEDPDSLLTDYQTKVDDTLITVEKEISKAINEVSTQIKDIENQNFGVVNYIDGQIYDAFDTKNRVLNGSKSASGHMWSVSGPGKDVAKVENGRLTSDINFYASLNYGKLLKYASFTYSYDLTYGTGGADNVTLIMQSEEGTLQKFIHLVVSPNGFVIHKVFNKNFILLGVKELENFKAESGKLYSMSLKLEGNVLTITLPNGYTNIITDDDFLLINPTIVTIQIGPQPDSSGIGYIHSVVAGEVPINNSVIEKSGMLKEDFIPYLKRLKLLEGTYTTEKHYINSESVSIGWNTILKYKTFISNDIVVKGRLCIYKENYSSADIIDFVATNYNSNFKVNISDYNHKGNDILVDKIRMGLASTNEYYLDVNILKDGCIINGEIEGLCEIDVSPTTNTYSSEKVKPLIAPDKFESKTTFVPTTDGYYTIAEGFKTQLNNMLVGKCRVMYDAPNQFGLYEINVNISPSSIQSTGNDVNRIISYGARPIKTVRMSVANGVQHLDIELQNVSNVDKTTIKVEFIGLGTYNVIQEPVVGAISLDDGGGNEQIITPT